MADETPGFLGRWARRKTDALQGKRLDEPAPAATAPVVPDVARTAAPPPPPAAPVSAPDDAVAPPEKKLLTLEDAQLLTRDSDFKPFMAGDVGPEVRNAAMKKLFADPHFNVMDGLDIYIDDYSRSDPIPESMLRQMTSAKFLNLFEDEEKEGKEGVKTAPATAPRETANNPTDETVAQSHEGPDLSDPAISPEHSSQPEPQPGSGASQENHAHTDLRLQPDHAAPAPDAGRGT
ncbi:MULTISPECIES: DUF3306 domain-containing protein [unclassified Polaromonas]|jgi:hypothetical protein|uniref:DUF3306 domain-containing protein n=1 Tax=unclassified Polaromonas TaxID=2638319 RepID=UPI000BC749B8|nr:MULTISPECIES: DUF3306 domain-containing protein [unclassified Polaromonas]OYY36078.1 MAG: hypothetical protein B7Y60_12780 [Polaromonas sp. 35-63-35]OYZ19999.1 MAG: hypothetical protein B7Y28_10360 [Polaromonas sp. 16-63-31]OYZ80100.1 MAG: hypothetical protein B7Y09_06805 [Polaromonas sp. 24-63-21]OZA52233.1 MAG: hypothetical protein B7X88_05630 [Polaromonas sp. 17-63-33]OZA88116.1 MAG: hypothetical protein B7X65_09815 [Polaromonas sp. 39-63-25]